MIKNGKIEIDLYSDLIKIMKDGLQDFGLDVSRIRDGDVCPTYYHLSKRVISPAPRKILYADAFNCPRPFIKNLTSLKNAVEHGDPLTPYLSRRLMDTTHYDPLLNEWGIHHLYLGAKTQNSQHVERTPELLFACFDQSHCYFIDVINKNVWTNHNLIETIHRNWPDLIKNHKIKWASYAENTTNKKANVFRRNKPKYFIKTDDGSFYAPTGGDMTSSGVNVEAIMHCVRSQQTLKEWEEHIEKNVDYLFKKITTNENGVKPPIKLNLVFDTKTKVAHVSSYDYDFKLKIGYLQ